mmetsp:Transcript_9581/g.17420  ORF Transcript_9581/g.17420 Transcript_9581/m.17420 type:complete len:737 (-) Transcript_9581:253-2463(-)|eukprot:CAMPEP_0198286030 /NCGR_PEP_ID=MMETSP1449-20131203/5205_1 /TAXON_ID=420275 /ORGANISM="Attheya septentrionalis, Strain CCMP2084" /LENGTH=736 /DNA_ID=CAMNT_0043983649 /DNA_START=210 /DNA_END=2420 /DNA_ORIENTATION=+
MMRKRGSSQRPVSRGRSNGVGPSSSNSSLGETNKDGVRVDDAALGEFISAVEGLKADEWKIRTQALDKLMASISKSAPSPQVKMWYASPVTLRRLAPPLIGLLLDPRSTVVKHTTSAIRTLVLRHCRNDARHLIKDLLNTVLDLHAQTVNVIRGYVLAMTLDIIPHCRFKSGLPLMLDRLRKDKSRDVRDGCAKYLKAVLESWVIPTTYLTHEIRVHIGNGLARGLTDSSQKVRMSAREAFEVLRGQDAEVWQIVVHKEGGPISNDARLKKQLLQNAERNPSVVIQTPSSSSSLDDDEMSYESSKSTRSDHVVSGATAAAAARRKLRTTSSSSSVGPPRTMIGRRNTASRSRSSRGRSQQPSTTSSRAGSTRSTSSQRSQSAGREGFSQQPSASLRSTSASRHHGSSSSSIQPPSPRGNHTSRGIQPPSPRQSLIQEANGQSSRSAFPFGSTLHSPSPRERKKKGVSPEEQVKSEAAVAIQAAVRGRAARKSILTIQPQQPDENKYSPSKELQMIQDARKQIKLGTTAEQMVHRRKTMEPGVIPPKQNDDDMSVASYNSFASELVSPVPKNIPPVRRGNEDNRPPLTIAPKARNGRSSVLLQRRLSHLFEEGDGGSTRSIVSSVGSINNGVGEHFDIGRELLGAHKKHMDNLMEILKLEMDAMRVSEKLMKQSILTEEDLVRYCESVELCMERRTDLTSDLKKKLHQLCEGGMGAAITDESSSSSQSPPTNGHANQ